jgi:G protein-coupled glucose receptor regulating Gpa2.
MSNVGDTTNDKDDYVAMYIVQICTGSISFLASLAMAASIQFSTRKLSTPYRRLVYGLCISDIIQSSSIITGPFASPAETPYAFWARGNTATCNVNGFMFSIGFTAVPMYVLALGVYYLCKLKRRMRDEVFRAKYEIWIHSFIIVWHLATNVISLCTKTFNPEVSGSYCFPNEYPANCNISPEIYGDCERGNSARIISVVFLIGPCLIICVGVCVCMGRLICHAFSLLKLSPPAQHTAQKSKRQLFRSKPRLDTSRTVAVSCGDAPDSGVEGKDTENDENLDAMQGPNGSHVAVVQELSILYRREMLIQALSFIGVFFFIYILPFFIGMMNIMKIKPGPRFMTVLSGIYPLGGLFNILVHTRPNIAALRRQEGYKGSWPRSFLQVLLAGGDVPNVVSKPSDAYHVGLDHLRGRNVAPLSVTNEGPGVFLKPGFEASKGHEQSWSNEKVVSFELFSYASVDEANNIDSFTDDHSKIQYDSSSVKF